VVGIASLGVVAPITTSGGQTPTIQIDTNGITYGLMQQASAYSVLGRAPTGTGNMAEILIAADRVLGRSGSGDIDGIQIVTNHITDANVTLAKIANAAANSKLVGSGAAGSGNPYAEITLGTNLSMSGTTLNAGGGALVNADHALTPAASSGADNFDTTLAISNTPVGMVRVSVNGVHYTLGDGVKTKDFWFTGDSGTTARAISAIVATDELYFNAAIVGFDLDANDVIDILYET